MIDSLAMGGDLIELFGPSGFSPSDAIESEPESPERQLLNAMSDFGIQCSEVVLDGKLHRFGKDRTSWYAAHADNIPAGAFGDWRLGVQENWVADVGRELSDEERALSMAQIEAAQQRRKEEEADRHRIAAERARDIIASSKPAPPDHPYLVAKGVAPGPARYIDDGRLVLPMYDPEGHICSLQFITPTGDKKFLSGGRARGATGFLGSMNGAKHVYLAEGFATASTIHAATGCPVFLSYSAHNMPVVAEHVSTLGVPLTIVADNDETGTGEKYALKAAQAVGCQVVVSPKGDVNDFEKEGGDVKQLLGHTTESWLIPFSELTQEPRPVKWLVKRWLPQSSLAMVFGPSGIGKTFLVLDLALSVATGRDWGKHITKPHPVAYLAGEGYAGISARLKGWAQVNNIKDAPFWVSRGGCQLDTLDGLNFAKTELSAMPQKPGLIIIDTLHRFLSGDENSSQDAAKMVRACDKLSQEFGATVLLVHHTGHGGERARGSTAWRGALDAEIGISTPDDGELLFVENHKQKDAESAPDTWGVLKSVELPWFDEDGEVVTTAVWETREPREPLATDGLGKEIKIIERAWFATGAEDMEGAPHISRSALSHFLETELGMTSRQVTKEVDSKNGLVSKLTQAEVIAHHAYGWRVVDAGLSSQFMLTRG